MEHIEYLESFGISSKEAKVLYSCMQSEGISASNIAKKTGIERTNVYKILESLVSKGLVSTYKLENVTRYRSLEPDNLLELLKDNIKKFEKNISTFKQIYSDKTHAPKVELFAGRTSMRRVIASIINKNLPYCAFGGVEQAYRQNYFENIPSGLLAQERKVSGRIILSPDEKTIILSNEEYRIASHPLPKNICIVINGEIVVILNWGEYCNAIIITDKKIANDYLILFDGLWIQAKKVSSKKLLSLELKDGDILR